MKPTTLEESLSLVPTHWPLTPKVDKWQKGDEECLTQYTPDGPELYWADFVPSSLGSTIGVDEIARRPIPQDVRESIAEMILHAARETAKDSAWAEDVLGRWILAGKP